jgi:hypothetical protein
VHAFCQDIKLNAQTTHLLGELEYGVDAFTHGPHLAEGTRARPRPVARRRRRRRKGPESAGR